MFDGDGLALALLRRFEDVEGVEFDAVNGARLGDTVRVKYAGETLYASFDDGDGSPCINIGDGERFIDCVTAATDGEAVGLLADWLDARYHFYGGER